MSVALYRSISRWRKLIQYGVVNLIKIPHDDSKRGADIGFDGVENTLLVPFSSAFSCTIIRKILLNRSLSISFSNLSSFM